VKFVAEGFQKLDPEHDWQTHRLTKLKILPRQVCRWWLQH